ncbi:MAG: DUF3833 domain-containing protein [Acidithiobacillus sp.]|uniref:DUF3833 domain-containing protein n=1 Tax=Acidithiobacillus sp. TaxID=1872118 RepID=UPI0025B87B2E|nr:DUF3833 domain-containing protein [Acidithiobacillus sp.]
MKTASKVVLGVAVIAALSGCATVPKDYAHTTPKFRLKEFFNGPLIATGMFQNRSGKAVNRFVVRMMGTWEGNQGTLVEHFTYIDPDGKKTYANRTWHLTEVNDHEFTGTAEGSAGDVKSASGKAYGFALHWSYDVKQPVGKSFYNLHADDWMYMIEPNVVIDRTDVTWYGIHAGEITLEMHKLPDTAANRAMVSQEK